MAPDIEPEAVRAERHRKSLENALAVVIAAAEEARKDGFYVEFSLNLNQFGRYALIGGVGIIKRF